MKLAQLSVFIVQLLFIILVFTIVFYKPALHVDSDNVLGSNSGPADNALGACIGDINQDGRVDDFDYAEVRVLFFKKLTHNSNADVNNDGIVDISDLHYIQKNFMLVCSPSE